MKARNLTSIAVVASLLAALPASVLAQGVGNLPALPTSFDLGPAGWQIVSAAGTPIPVVRDPNGPPWIKNLNGSGSAPLVAQPGFSAQVHEMLQVSGNLPWTDWHEDILSPGWSWVPVFFNVNGNPASNLQIANTPGSPIAGGSISYVFDPVLPGSTVEILKRLVFNAGIPGAVHVGSVQVAQYPTPEPASLACLALGGIMLLRKRRAVR